MLSSKTQKKAKSQKNKKSTVTIKNGKDKTHSAPIAIGTKTVGSFNISQGNARYPGSIRIRGHDLVAQITAPNLTASPVTLPVATTLFNIEVNPTGALFEGTRLSRFGDVYDKFLFRAIRFRFESAVATSQSGNLVMAYDVDPSDATPAATLAGLQQFMSMANSVMFNCWMPTSLNTRLADRQEFYYTTPSSTDERLSNQGQIYVALGTALSVPAGGLSLGNLSIEYDIELYDPSLEAADDLYVQNSASTFTVPADGNSYAIPLLSGGATTTVSSGTSQIAEVGVGEAFTNLGIGEYIMNVTGTMDAAADDFATVFPSGGNGTNWVSLFGDADTWTGTGLPVPRSSAYRIFIDETVPLAQRFVKAVMIGDAGNADTVDLLKYAVSLTKAGARLGLFSALSASPEGTKPTGSARARQTSDTRGVPRLPSQPVAASRSRS